MLRLSVTVRGVVIMLITAGVSLAGITSGQDPVAVNAVSETDDDCGSTNDGYTCFTRQTSNLTVTAADTSLSLLTVDEYSEGESQRPSSNAWNENLTTVTVSGGTRATGSAISFRQTVQLYSYHMEQPSTPSGTDRAVVTAYAPSLTLNGQPATPGLSRSAGLSCTYQGAYERCTVEGIPLTTVGFNCVNPFTMLSRNLDSVLDCIRQDAEDRVPMRAILP